MTDSRFKGEQMSMNTTFGAWGRNSKESQKEQQKKRTIKKILLMSTMDKQIMKNLLRIFQKGSTYLKDGKENLINYGKTILDKEKQKELEQLLLQLESLLPMKKEAGSVNATEQVEDKKTKENDATVDKEDLNERSRKDGDKELMNLKELNDTFLQIIKYFVLSPVEKLYINKIEAEMEESDRLDREIEEVQEKINGEKKKKIDKYINEKDNGKPDVTKKETREYLLSQITAYENKLEKSNQKLNDIVAHNNQLREKINQLRKEKTVIEEIYKKLKQELETKKQNVENTIRSAGKAYFSRNRAEEDLKNLQAKAEEQKIKFEQEYKELNKNIQYDKRFKQFIKGKQNEKEVLANLEKAIKKNQEIINEKTKSNQDIDNEYKLSNEKEEEIKKAFERIKKETGIYKSKESGGNESMDKESKELLSVFVNLYQKNTIMNKFVTELTEEVEELEKKIEEKKKEIQLYSTKGATSDNQRRELKIELTKKIEQEEKKKAILKAQYDKSIETINLIKGYLENVFQAIEVEPEIIEKLKISAITEENMVYFLGILEQKGIDAISEYARLIAEQLKLEKGDAPGVAQQIDDLNNIIAYENANIMNYYSSSNQNKQDNAQLDDLLNSNFKDEDHDGVPDPEGKSGKPGILTQEELRKIALDALNKKFLATNQNKPQTISGSKNKGTKERNKQPKK